jgi:hypothetical protein
VPEGREEPLVTEIPRGSYVPVFRPRTDMPRRIRATVTEAPDAEPGGAPPPASPRYLSFASGVAIGLFLASLASIALVIILRTNSTSSDRPSRDLVESPIWAGFRSSNVVLAVGTPLFSRSTEGLERNFSANFPEDLALADRLLVHRPAYPLWNEWAPFEDVAAAVNLDRFLGELNSTVTVTPARQISFGRWPVRKP